MEASNNQKLVTYASVYGENHLPCTYTINYTDYTWVDLNSNGQMYYTCKSLNKM